jgi:hypothetical protein
VRGAVPGVALEQSRCRVGEEGQEYVVGLGDIEGPFQGAPGGSRVPERVPCDRLQQERLHQQERLACGDGACDDGRERDNGRLRIVASQPERRHGGAHGRGIAQLFVHLGQGGFDAIGLAQPLGDHGALAGDVPVIGAEIT